jgi:hypothetical protein
MVDDGAKAAKVQEALHIVPTCVLVPYEPKLTVGGVFRVPTASNILAVIAAMTPTL